MVEPRDLFRQFAAKWKIFPKHTRYHGKQGTITAQKPENKAQTTKIHAGLLYLKSFLTTKLHAYSIKDKQLNQWSFI